MSRYNNLSIEAYASGTTPIVDPKNDLVKAEGIQYRTIYPGGIYADASFYVPRPIVDWWELNGATRVVFRNDTRQCYEGYITNFQRQADQTGQGVLVRTTGGWGHILMNWPIRKRWCDDRLTNDVWALQTSLGTVTLNTEQWQVERQDRIKITPNAGAFASASYIALRYGMPTGETIKRIYYEYDFSEKAGQSWEQSVWRSTDGSTFTQMGTAETYAVGSTTIHTATGVGTVDVTLATPSQNAELRYYARAANTPVNDDLNHGLWQDLKVYSETGSINMAEIAKDVITEVTDINSTTEFVFSAGSPLSLEPYIADNFQSAADILSDITNKGDGAYNRWSAYLLPSEQRVYVPNSKPTLVILQYQATTDYEYTIGLSDLGKNLLAPFTISEDYDSIANWIVVQYTDAKGVVNYRSPDDNASLKDDTSITAYGRRGEVLSVPGVSTVDIADAIGQRYKASYKDPQFRLTSPITVKEFIRGKGGHIYPTSQIQALFRLRIDEFGQAQIGSSQGLTFVITQTYYDNDTEVCQLTAGVPDAPLMLRYTAPRTAVGASGTTPAGTVTRSVTDEMLARMGISRAKWAKMTPKQRRAAKRAAGL